MSWDAHLAKLNAAVKCHAALHGTDGVQWAGHAQLALPADEVKYIIAGFANPNSLFASGPKVLTVKHMATRADDHLIILKHGTDGLVAVKTAKTVIFCKFSENDVTPANANIATQNFGEYMKGIGY